MTLTVQRHGAGTWESEAGDGGLLAAASRARPRRCDKGDVAAAAEDPQERRTAGASGEESPGSAEGPTLWGPLPPGPGPPCRVPAVWPESQSSAPSPLSGQTRPRPPLRPLCGAASPLWAAPPVSHVYAPLLSLCPMVRASAGRAGGDSPSASQPKPKTRRTPCLGGSAHPFSSLQPLPTTPPSRCIPSGRLCSWEPPGQAWPGTPKPPHMLPGPRSQQASGHRPWAQHARREAGLALAKDGGHGAPGEDSRQARGLGPGRQRLRPHLSALELALLIPCPLPPHPLALGRGPWAGGAKLLARSGVRTRGHVRPQVDTPDDKSLIQSLSWPLILGPPLLSYL